MGDRAATDVGNGNGPYFAQALADGILTAATLNVGAVAQILDCLNGKILRIDPETGEGIPSNPFYDPTKTKLLPYQKYGPLDYETRLG